MPQRQNSAAFRRLRHFLSQERCRHLPDEHLLNRFIADHDEGAFTALFKRHSPMVLGVCQSVLRHTQDAEDACQASFLMLARRAATIRRKTAVASWLHGVAYRLAMNLQSSRKQTASTDATLKSRSPSPLDALSGRELGEVIHQELQRLPEQYRLPLILCYLEGRTKDEAARHLGWPAATLKGRLDRGREMLRKRLTRRGLTLGSTLLTTILVPNAPVVSAPVTVAAAMALIAGKPLGAEISAQTVALVSEGIKGMLVSKLKMLAAMVVTAGILTGGVGFLAYKIAAREQVVANDVAKSIVAQIAEPKKLESKEGEKGRVDLHGDALPPGAVARVGTTRFLQREDRLWRSPPVFTADGKTLISSDGTSIRFFDANSGKTLREIAAGASVKYQDFSSFALAPDEKTIVTGSLSPPTIQVWDMATGKELHHFATAFGIFAPGRFSPDGKTFAAPQGGTIHIWDTETWKETRQIKWPSSNSFDFLPDGKTLVFFRDKALRWLDVSAEGEIRRLPVSFDSVSLLRLSSDGKRLAAFVREGNKPNTGLLCVWDGATGKELWRTVLATKGGYFGVWFPDNLTIVASGDVLDDQSVVRRTLFFEAATGKELRRWDGDDFYCSQMCFTPDGKTMAQVGVGSVIQLRDVTTGKLARTVPRLPDYVDALGFTANGQSLVSIGATGWTGNWNPYSGAEIAPLRAPPADVLAPPMSRAMNRASPALSPDATKAALVDSDGVLHVWEVASGKTLCRIKQVEPRYQGIGYQGEPAQFSPDGRLILVSHHNDFGIYEIDSGKRRHLFPFDSDINAPPLGAFSPDGGVLASSVPARKGPRAIHLWDISTGKELRRLSWEDKTAPVALVFSRDSKRLIVAHDGPGAGQGGGGQGAQPYWRMWDVTTGRELRRLPGKPAVRKLVISPDGRTLAAPLANGALRWEIANGMLLWELATWEERGHFVRHLNDIATLSFSPDGRLLASGSKDQTAVVWDVTGLAPDGKLPLRTVQADELPRLWSELNDADAAKAYRAMWTLVSAQNQAIPFLAERLKPVAAVSGERIARLVRELDNEVFKVRAQATKELEELGDLAEPALTKALAGTPTLETRRRLEGLLDTVYAKPLSAQQIHEMALEVLENDGTPQARQVLQTLAKGAPGARLTNEAQASLDRLAKRAEAAQ